MLSNEPDASLYRRRDFFGSKFIEKPFRASLPRTNGHSVRRYLLEVRLRRALLEIARGESLTASAYAADFADSAHLSRTFRRMTGIAPSSILKHSRVVPSQNSKFVQVFFRPPVLSVMVMLKIQQRKFRFR
jgi:AraC-like DNA-binding protein